MYTNGFITIDSIVSQLMYRGQDYSTSNYDYWYNLAIQGLTQMNIFNLRTTNIAYLEVPATNIIQMPMDYVDYVQIGYVDNAGVFQTGTLDANLFPVPHETCGTDDSRVLRSEKLVQSSLFLGGVNNQAVLYGGWINTPYNLTGGYNYFYYNVNRLTNELYLSGLVPGQVIAMEYKSSGVRLDGITMIRLQATEALISWMMMTAQKFNVIQSAENWKVTHYEDLNELESLDQAITMDEFKDILYGTWKQTPKR